MADIEKIMEILRDPTSDLEVVIRRTRPVSDASKAPVVPPKPKVPRKPYSQREKELRDRAAELDRREREVAQRERSSSSYISSPRVDDGESYHN
jgi:hypothetical protein